MISGVVTNTGTVEGKEVAQAYVSPRDMKAAGWEAPKRLVAFQKFDLQPGASANFSQRIDGRLLATFNPNTDGWEIAEGGYTVMFGQASDELTQKTDITLHGTSWGAAKKAE